MADKHTFAAPIQEARGGGAYVEVPFDVEGAFGKKRVPVLATIDGVEYRGSLVRMGGGPHVLGVLKSIRDGLGKQAGDVVEIVLEEDVAPREVEVPPDFRKALEGEPAAAGAFEALAYSHKREYVRWINDAKKSETRERRIATSLEMLARGEVR